VLTDASARDNTLHQMLNVIQGYLDSKNVVSSSNQGNTPNDDILVVPSSESDNSQDPTVSTPTATPTSDNGSTQAPTTASEMFSRGEMAIGEFIGRVQSDFKSAMESDEDKSAREKIKVGMKEARSVTSSISKSAKSALKDLALTGPKGTHSANNTIASYPTEIEAIMGVCFDS
jgi:hypothetical protein